MRLFTSAAVAAALMTLSLHSPALAESKPKMMMADAREMLPDDLVGVWKSAPNARQTAHLRSFQYTADGKLLVNFINIGLDGKQMIGHWSLQVDGSPGYEYRSDNASTPIAEIRFKKVSPRTFELSNIVAGELQSQAVYILSEDGKTLNLTRTPKNGPQTKVQYVKWDGK